MITLTAKIQAVTGKEQELEATLRDLVTATATEEGSVEYRLHKIINAPGAFRFVEKFKNQAAFDFHSNSEHFKTLGSKIGKLTEGEGELEMLEMIDSIPE